MPPDCGGRARRDGPTLRSALATRRVDPVVGREPCESAQARVVALRALGPQVVLRTRHLYSRLRGGHDFTPFRLWSSPARHDDRAVSHSRTCPLGTPINSLLLVANIGKHSDGVGCRSLLAAHQTLLFKMQHRPFFVDKTNIC